jgi:hypothetical protein
MNGLTHPTTGLRTPHPLPSVGAFNAQASDLGVSHPFSHSAGDRSLMVSRDRPPPTPYPYSPTKQQPQLEQGKGLGKGKDRPEERPVV